jgi:hypothetical protein
VAERAPRDVLLELMEWTPAAVVADVDPSQTQECERIARYLDDLARRLATKRHHDEGHPGRVPDS